ncbi:TY-Chap domain-containing protein [Geodermatophilus sp. URMC 61]|uniref:TY-Chap domain-containing protein n=1 Tax=Geodermatophilus sp. URMC 61 TaxID=3423411 RepID=UPI00406C683A
MKTWDEVRQTTREAVDAVEEEREDFAVLTLTNSDRYVQWIVGNIGKLRVEVSSNEALGERVHSPEALAQLLALGVDVTAPDPNYVYEPATAEEATELVVRIVREVFGMQASEVEGIELG